MTYNILIIKNRLGRRDKVILQKYLDWFKVHTPIEIKVEEMATDIDVSFALVGNGVKTGAIADKNTVATLRKYVPENTYHAVVFCYGNPVTKGVRVSCTNGEDRQQNLYPNTEFIQLSKYDDNGKLLNHELFHAFFAKAQRVGCPVVDNMDTYYRDNIFDTDNGDTSRTIALRSLAPYWGKILTFTQESKLERIATIIRTPNDKETPGVLTAVNGSATFVCKSLELPWLNNARNISCIPTGTYLVKFTRSLKFPLGTYEIQNVPNRSGIRFHVGNYAYKAFGSPDIEGCIILGNAFQDINGDKVPDVVNSTITVKAFEGFFNKQDFTLTIK